jgi:hypothetical protein
VDELGNAGVSAAIAIAGFAIILGSVFSLTGLLIGSALMIGGYASATMLLENFDKNKKNLEEQYKNQVADTLVKGGLMMVPKGISNAPTHINFMGYGLFKPAFYAAITAREQIAPDEASLTETDRLRESIDSAIGISR